ncbi:chloroplastic group IIA intron splicing facilitator CRS1, chloroplastic [Iris pallida]|uniref:Chloroplastic group IIA intron splicing facilitator CRS1, chloroplastic n=1 Tax=Iris pallida TaxID=29817 RepID=A0AAX6ILI3_IRIPA|nr:chloroplastic group IIA intron splicing facilitator CRS1, chloroplastic [Iris pallida]
MHLFSSSLFPSNTLHPITISSKLSTTAQQTKPINKTPTPPWILSPSQNQQLLNISSTNKSKLSSNTNQDQDQDRSLTGKVPGGRTRQAMKNIAQSISKLQELEPTNHQGEEEAEDEEDGNAVVPWARAKRTRAPPTVWRRERKERTAPTAAEREIPEGELRRLTGEARRLRSWVRAKKAGVTEEVVDEIRRAWRKEELAMVRIVEPLCRNMDRACEIVEMKTGGLVVWRKKDTLVVYRRTNFHSTTVPAVAVDEKPSETLNSGMVYGITDGLIIQKEREGEYPQPSMNWMLKEVGTINETLYVREADRLLNDLGPRFIDWWWKKPLPVDADLLPEFVPEFKPPFRRCPPRERPKLTDDELTYLRKLARPLPTHFALGKNTKLQGLAAAIVKLWEKCLIAKIAVKVGIPHTNNQQMSWELKATSHRRSCDIKKQVLYHTIQG